MKQSRPKKQALINRPMPAVQRPTGIKKPGLITGKGGQESNYRDCFTNIVKMEKGEA